MKCPDLHNLKNGCSKGLLAAVFVLGFFIFSGLAVSRQTNPTVPQTTWVASNSAFPIKGFHYQPQLQKVYKRQNAAILLFPKTNLALFHNKRATVSLKLHLDVSLPQRQVFKFCPVKTISKNGKNDPSLILA